MTTGRIIKRNGKWAYVISMPPDPATGKRKQRWRSGFETRKAADESMRVDLGAIEESGVIRLFTVSEYFEEWLSRGVDGKRAPRTLEFYRFCSDRISEHVGNVRLDKLSPHRIEEIYSELSERMTSSSVHGIHRTLRAALNRAVKWGYLRVSPMSRVDAPSMRVAQRSTLNIDQAQLVVEWLRHRHPVSFVGTYLAVYSGMRRGEIAGLTWSDVDWDTAALRVTRSRQRFNQRDIVGNPKTEKSNRVVPVSHDVMRTLLTWRKQQQEHTVYRGERWYDDVYILRHIDGSMYDPNTLTKDLHKAEKALDLPLVSFHDLRHTHATLLLEAGVALKTVSERLGHSSIKLTGDVYAHVTEAMQRGAVDALDIAFKKGSEK